VPVAQHSASSSSEDYFQTVVIKSLLDILKDQSLSSHHHTVIEAIMSIFKTQGLKCVTFLPQVRIAVTLHEYIGLTAMHRSFPPLHPSL
jgi:FKBP12-rapamycin complex-associated protein